ncbi:adenylyltransferase/cytidyltransferase family protein [Candidatus Uhrbacteria bacterium]|jgi:nicotinamide-nucleotide adenylyltransferase|nr:adenylyltransferase/cytidyltransferase family protein [Candidatus Uhrbacteria bacterium]
MSTCIFPGRFQPFHIGHLMVAKGMIKSCPNVVIVICSGDHHDDDIFSTEKVREMISAALLEAEIMDATIAEVSDCTDDAEWADKVLEAAGWPEDPQIWSGDEAVRALFEGLEKRTQKISPVPGFVGKEIREMISGNDKNWRTKVPAGAMDVVYDKMQEGKQ